MHRANSRRRTRCDIYSVPEIDLLAKMTGFTLLGAEEFMTGNKPSQDTWGVNFILRPMKRDPENFIPVNTPLLSGNERKYIYECVDTGWISSEGEFIRRFEDEFAKYIGRKSESLFRMDQLPLTSLFRH